MSRQPYEPEYVGREPDPIREQALERCLPNSAEAERAVLGAVILDNSLISQAMALLTADDFYIPSHRRIFVAMVALVGQDREIDPILIAAELQKENALEGVGGISFITNLTYGLPHSTNISNYAKLIAGKTSLRRLIAAANAITQEALEQEDEPEAILNHAEQRLMSVITDAEKVSGGTTRRSFAQVAESVNSEFAEWKEGKTRALRTFIPELDRELKLGGEARGELIYIGAATSRGKTALALQVARMQAMRGHKVLIFSLEMSAEALFMRAISSMGHVENWKIRPDMFHFPETVERVASGFTQVKKLPIIVDDQTRDLAQLVAIARDEVRYNGVEKIIVDYAQLVEAGLDRASRERQVAMVSITLKGLARRLYVPIIATSALSRAANKEEEPDLEHMRESGQMEFDADVVLLPYGAKKRTDEDVVAMKLYCPKQRNGRSGWKIDIDFDKTYQTFMTAQMYGDATEYENTQPRLPPSSSEPAAPAEPPEQLAPVPPSQAVLDELDDADFSQGGDDAW